MIILIINFLIIIKMEKLNLEKYVNLPEDIIKNNFIC